MKEARPQRPHSVVPFMGNVQAGTSRDRRWIARNRGVEGLFWGKQNALELKVIVVQLCEGIKSYYPLANFTIVTSILTLNKKHCRVASFLRRRVCVRAFLWWERPCLE